MTTITYHPTRLHDRMEARIDDTVICLIEPDVRGMWAAFTVGGPVAYGTTPDHAVTGYRRVSQRTHVIKENA